MLDVRPRLQKAMATKNEFDDASIVEAFVSYLAKERYPGICVEARPDLDNRRSSDIDAIAGPLAIEHTSVDTIENQRRDSAWFGKIAFTTRAALRLDSDLSAPAHFPVRGSHGGTGLERNQGGVRRLDIPCCPQPRRRQAFDSNYGRSL